MQIVKAQGSLGEGFQMTTAEIPNMTGWKIHHEWVDVFPIENWEFSSQSC